MSVKPKKFLGQHFLNDESIARQIADTLSLEGYEYVLEIGPGMGVLTQFLVKQDFTTEVVEIDTESVSFGPYNKEDWEKYIEIRKSQSTFDFLFKTPAILLFKDGQLVNMVERHQIEGRPAQVIAQHLISVFQEHFN